MVLTIALGFGSVAPSVGADEPEKKDEQKPENGKPESGADSVVVKTKEGNQLTRKGEIVEETAAKIVLNLADGKTSTIKRDEIVRIEYGGQPIGMVKGDIALGKNDHEGAAKEYNAAGLEAARSHCGGSRVLPGEQVRRGRRAVRGGRQGLAGVDLGS
jgi:hypothetical protein